jgi:hypothetical protein
MRLLGKAARFAVKKQLLTVFLGLCVVGIVIGTQSRPDSNAVPYEELFSNMCVVSYRDTPSDTTARFVVELAAGNKVFQRYDVDAGVFLPPVRERDYNRGITGTEYRPLRVRGHVAQGVWLDVPHRSGLSLLPDQFSELYRATMDYVKPVSILTGALGTLSGYSIGYRIGSWNSTLRSRRVQERVLATPHLGRELAREAWRRVLLEPVVTAGEDDAERFLRIRTTQRLYANFFRITVADSDGFIPREAARLDSLGRSRESRAMLAFAEAVRRASQDSVALTSADFTAVERWASLLVRQGHWAHDAIPTAREARAQYLGMLAWYGVAPPSPEIDRVWVGPRLLVREGDTEGFVADDIAATPVACPIGWRPLVNEQKTGANAMASAWMSDHPEFTVLPAIVDRIRGALEERRAAIAAQAETRRATQAAAAAAAAARAAQAQAAAHASAITVTPLPARAESSAVVDSATARRSTGARAAARDTTLDSLPVPAIRDTLTMVSGDSR